MGLGTMLDDMLRTRSHIRAARAMFRLPAGFALSARDLGRRAGMDNKLAQAALQDMAGAGLIDATKSRSAIFYRLNSEHALYDPLKGLFEAEGRLLEELTQSLLGEIHRRGLPVQRIFLFGSVVRATDQPGSDVDVAVITSARDRDQVELDLQSVAEALRPRFGHTLHFVVEGRKLERLLADEASAEGFWRTVATQGRELRE